MFFNKGAFNQGFKRAGVRTSYKFCYSAFVQNNQRMFASSILRDTALMTTTNARELIAINARMELQNLITFQQLDVEDDESSVVPGNEETDDM